LYQLVVKSKLSEPMREKIRDHYDHLVNFYDLPGPEIFAMAMDICNASRLSDIEGAQEKNDALKLEDFPGEEATACLPAAQKHVKVLQRGYAPRYRTGSKLLSKLNKSSCEEFHRNAFTKLDLVKRMESTYKLSDPKLITADVYYHELGPIGIVSWVQKEHGKLFTDHEWPALASKLPKINLAGTETNLPSTYASKVVEGRGGANTTDAARPIIFVLTALILLRRVSTREAITANKKTNRSEKRLLRGSTFSRLI
jgi:hypothetical protein